MVIGFFPSSSSYYSLMPPTVAESATGIVFGLIVIWAVKRAITYRRAIQLIRLPGYRNLGPDNSSLYGLIHAKLMQHIEDCHIFANQHLDYEHFGWDVISSISWFTPKLRFFIADPAVFQRVGASRTVFTKSLEIYEAFNTFGRNILATEGAEWARHRKITSRAFTEPNMQMVWKQTTRIVQEMFESDWDHRGDVVALEDTLHTTTQLSMLVIMAAGFGHDAQWMTHKTPPLGHVLTFRQALQDVVDNIILRASLPQWVWGSPADRDTLAVSGIAGRGWLGKKVQHAAIAFSELAKYMREMLREELSGVTDKASEREGGTLFRNLVDALVNEDGGIPSGKNDVFGNMFVFLFAGFETTAHSVTYALGLLALDEAEQQRLYDHIKDVLQDREPAFEDVPKLSRVLAVFYETLRLYPAAPEQTRDVEEDIVFSVQAALSESDVANSATLGGKDARRTEVLVPRGSEVIVDTVGLHHNPRYWPDSYTFKPDRFMDPNWPREAFTSFAAGSRSCMGRRFGEVEAIAIITLIIRRYRVSVDTVRFPDIAGETKLQHRERVLKSFMSLVIRPSGTIPLIFTRR
ncbi:hypothetical protein FRB93_000904 [Tulasnella sp. JGI-2019a]|nr:hypothetical protein FRB93_000904 [Tulasnella sp. JGI-2019a]